MTTFQLVFAVFIIFILYKVLRRYQKKDISVQEFVFWAVFWILSGVVILLPQTSSWLANRFGIGRGVDLIIYVSIFFLVYAIFRLNVSLHHMEENITKLVREISYLKNQLNEDKKDNEAS